MVFFTPEDDYLNFACLRQLATELKNVWFRKVELHLVTDKQLFKYQKKNLQIIYIFPRRVLLQSGAKNSKAGYALTFLMIFIKCDAFAPYCKRSGSYFTVKEFIIHPLLSGLHCLLLCSFCFHTDDDVVSYSPDLHDF